MIRPEEIGAHDLCAQKGDIGSDLFRHPEGAGLLFGRLRGIGVCIASPDDLMEDRPNAVKVGIGGSSDLDHNPKFNTVCIISRAQTYGVSGGGFRFSVFSSCAGTWRTRSDCSGILSWLD